MIRRKTHDNGGQGLQLSVESWKNETHGLFDYQSVSGVTVQRYSVGGPMKVFRNWITCDTALVSLEDARKGILPPEDYEFLFSITSKTTNGQQTLSVSAPQPIPPLKIGSDTIHTNSYISIKNNRSLFHTLTPGDVIRLGRLSFLILQLKLNNKVQVYKNADYQEKKNNNILKINKEHTGTCRICLGEETTEGNYLVSACRCSGSCEFVHIQCLKIWIDSKIKKESKGIATVYNFTKFECELCKTPYPTVVENGDQRLDLMTIEKPVLPYIMLQTIPDKKDPKQPANPLQPQQKQKLTKSLYVITADQSKPVKLGRGHQSDIILDDISVSRAHAQILFKKNEFVLRDLDSKFGTLVEMKKQMQIKDELRIQSGRSLYTFRYAPKIRTCNYIQ